MHGVRNLRQGDFVVDIVIDIIFDDRRGVFVHGRGVEIGRLDQLYQLEQNRGNLRISLRVDKLSLVPVG